MFKRPSSRRRASKGKAETVELNLVPMMDALVTMIAFMLFTLSFLNIVSIESPVPIASSRDVEKKLDEKPLQLTLSVRDQESEIWSPFERIAPSRIQNLPDGSPDIVAIHDKLVEIKQKFPRESKIVFVPNTKVTYDVLIAVMDSLRMMTPTDPPIFLKNEATGIDEPLKSLFPEVIFGNLLGGGER